MKIATELQSLEILKKNVKELKVKRIVILINLDPAHISTGTLNTETFTCFIWTL